MEGSVHSIITTRSHVVFCLDSAYSFILFIVVENIIGNRYFKPINLSYLWYQQGDYIVHIFLRIRDSLLELNYWRPIMHLSVPSPWKLYGLMLSATNFPGIQCSLMILQPVYFQSSP